MLSIFTIIFTLISFSVSAQIVASDMELRFSAKEKALKNIMISNTSKASSFAVNTQVVELINPGEKEPQYVPSNKMFVIPPQFTLTPEGQRKVRLVSNITPSSKERIFKVRFTPSITKKEVSASTDNITPKIQILTGVGILASIAPKNPKENLIWERDESGIKFTNNGNFNVVIARKEKCLKGVCYQIPGKRLFTSASWYLKLPEPLKFKPVKLEVFTNGRPKEVTVPYEY